jgi:uncharacterized protein
MKVVAQSVRLSASDLSNHLACNHLTMLDLSVAKAIRPAPKWNSPDAWVLQQLGLAHERAYIANLESQGLVIANLQDVGSEEIAMSETAAAMQRGTDAIVQAAVGSGSWFGRPDVLRKTPRPSRLGGWSYEPYDCKLALETKAATVLQLSLYAELLAGIQGNIPESMHVVPPNAGFVPETYRVLDFAAYYRSVKQRLENAVKNGGNGPASYPEPMEHCEICRWRAECETRRRTDDHLSLVAGVSRLQCKQLYTWGVKTVVSLACIPLPLQHNPERGSKNGYIRVREQARIQVAGRAAGKPEYELLPLGEDYGLHGLPEPSPGDVFFDLESDRFAAAGGIEYLFGGVTCDENGNPTYSCRLAITAEEERLAFEWFVDLVIARLKQFPAMHIYHFSGYEPGALKRLMGRHATREDEIDRLLRGRVFVDLHGIVKRTLRASVEEYSLKALEPFFGFERKLPLESARGAMRQMQHALELGTVASLDDQIRPSIELYNADDCRSTVGLRNWMERERVTLLQAGHNIPRPAAGDGAAPEAVGERQQRTAELALLLRAGVPEERDNRNEEQQARWLLSYLLDWHRRESKAAWWEYYRLEALSDEDLLEEKCGISGLQLLERLGIERKIPTDRYSYPKQEVQVRQDDELNAREVSFGSVAAIDPVERIVDIKKTKKTADLHPGAVFVKDTGPNTDELADALYRIGTSVAEHGMEGPGPYRAARDLLLRRPPRLSSGESSVIKRGEGTVAAARRLAGQLDHSLLAIQGPPGAGKQGKKVGVTATSHKIISNVLAKAAEAAQKEGITGLKCVQKIKKEDKPEHDPPYLKTTLKNDETLAEFQAGANVLAGTQWLLAREEYFEALDVLIVDEAGQMALTNVLAVAQSAKSVVLLGDPQQLEQPLQGSHPEGSDVSALEHLLAGAKTIPPDKGLFLEKTWRLHPRLCEFTSEAFYEGRLLSRDGLEKQRIEGHPWLSESHLWWVPVLHEGNQNAAAEEVDVITSVVESLLKPEVKWIDDEGNGRELQLSDILIVAPYNAQVSDLSAKIPGARIGTVDKFQGQQAPIVIYSLTTSSPEDAPKGMEFLYSLNRLNVATSRAQAMAIIIGSPRLLEPECHSPRQMQLANALCRYAEIAAIASKT